MDAVFRLSCSYLFTTGKLRSNTHATTGQTHTHTQREVFVMMGEKSRFSNTSFALSALYRVVSLYLTNVKHEGKTSPMGLKCVFPLAHRTEATRVESYGRKINFPSFAQRERFSLWLAICVFFACTHAFTFTHTRGWVFFSACFFPVVLVHGFVRF